MGQCYENEQIKSQAAAIRCYTRAVDSGDREGTFSVRINHVLEQQHAQGQPSCRPRSACCLSWWQAQCQNKAVSMSRCACLLCDCSCGV